MIRSVSILQMILRLAFLIAIALGIALWTGHGYEFLKLHMWLGFIVTFDLLLLAIVGLLARVPFALPLIAIVWAALLPIIGIWQMRALPGSNHWIIQVIHLIIGLGAVALGESLSKRSSRRIIAR